MGNKRVKISLGHRQISTIRYALDILAQDYSDETPAARKLHKDIESVENALHRATRDRLGLGNVPKNKTCQEPVKKSIPGEGDLK